MSQLNAEEVKEWVSELENDNIHREMRELTKSRYSYLDMTDMPDLPEHLTRGDAMAYPSPRLKNLVRRLIAEVRPYPTYTRVVPMSESGSTPAGDLVKQAEKVEQGMSLFHARANNGGRVSETIFWHELMSYAGIMTIHYVGDEKMPFAVETPDPITCFFPVREGPFRPDVLGRRFRKLMREVHGNYTNMRERKRPYMKTSGAWDFYDPGKNGGAEYPADGVPLSGKGNFQKMCEFYTLDDGEYTYHIAMNTHKSKG